MIVLRYDPTFSKENTWFILISGNTIRARISEAASKEVVCDIELRWRRPRAGALFIRPMNSELDTWMIESGVVHADLARVQIQLTGVPAYVVEAFKAL